MPKLAMQFRKSGQREERRRRVLSDDRTSTEEVSGAESPDAPTNESGAAGASRQTRSYSEHAHPERQPRVIDFVPSKAWALALLFLGGVAMLAGVLALHAQLGNLREPFTAEELAPFQLSSRGSLASWYSAWLLAGAACGSLLLYSLRRHRVDDYRGYYRVWLWAGALLMLASVDAVAGLHLALRRLLVVASGTTLHASGDLWWIAVLGTVYAALGVRLLFEVKASRGTFAAILLAGACYGVAIAARFGAITQWTPDVIEMLQHGAVLAGHLLVVLAVGVNLRYVLLDIQGLLPPRAERPRKQRKTRQSAKSDAKADSGEPAKRPRTSRRSDLEPVAKSTDETKSSSSSSGPKLAAKTRASAASPAAKTKSPSSDSDDDGLDQVAEEAREIGMDPAAYASLSKSERRRLRKQHRRSGRRAA